VPSFFIVEETVKQGNSMRKIADRADSFLGLLFNPIDGDNVFPPI
jgi:hypothetical protein